MGPDIVSFVEKTTAAKTPHELNDTLIQAFGQIGFEYLAYADVGRFRKTGDMSYLSMVMTKPGEWVQRYAGENYGADDPVLHVAFNSPRPFAWTDISTVMTPTKLQARILAESRECGLKSGLTVPLIGTNSQLALLSASADQEGRALPATVNMAAVLATQFHLAHILLQPEPPEVPDYVALAPREREALIWTAKGKSAWETGTILNLSERTVNQYITSAMKKLQAPNRTYAVFKALQIGLIAP